jgi:hypothetical protein
VIAATFIHPFRSYVGIEYLENLHIIALDLYNRFEEKREGLYTDNPDILTLLKDKPEVSFINGDFLQSDWSDASLLFANSTCFSPDLMESLSVKADEVKVGAYFITFTKKLPSLSENWIVFDSFRRLMSWGIATVYIHKKVK